MSNCTYTCFVQYVMFKRQVDGPSNDYTYAHCNYTHEKNDGDNSTSTSSTFLRVFRLRLITNCPFVTAIATVIPFITFEVSENTTSMVTFVGIYSIKYCVITVKISSRYTIFFFITAIFTIYSSITSEAYESALSTVTFKEIRFVK